MKTVELIKEFQNWYLNVEKDQINASKQSNYSNINQFIRFLVTLN